MDENIVDVKEMASWLMLGVTRTQQLAKQNILIKAGHGTYKLKESMQAYVSFLKRGGSGDDDGGDDSAGNHRANYEKERARYTRAKADKAEVEASLLKGTTHDAAAVERVWVDAIANVRVKLLALPTTLAAQLDGVDTPAERQDIISDGVNEALSELVEYRPEVLTDEYVKAQGVQTEEVEEDTEEV